MEPGLEPKPENPGLCIKFGTRVFKIKTRETRVLRFFELKHKSTKIEHVSQISVKIRTIFNGLMSHLKISMNR